MQLLSWCAVNPNAERGYYVLTTEFERGLRDNWVSPPYWAYQCVWDHIMRRVRGALLPQLEHATETVSKRL
jgi:hypothetical protein